MLARSSLAHRLPVPLLARLSGRQKLVNSVLVLLVAGGIAYAVTTLSGGATQEAAARTATATRGVVQSTISGTGNLQAPTNIGVDFRTAGVVTKIFVKAGQHVRPGQALAQVDPTEARQTLKTALANLHTAEARLAQTTQGLSPQEIRQTEVAADQARSSVTQARQSLKQTRRAASSDLTSLRLSVSQAEKSLAAAKESSRGSATTSSLSVSQARKAVGDAKRAAKQNARSYQAAVDQARQGLRNATGSAQQNAVSYQAAVDQAQQALRNAQDSAAQNATSYQTSVDQANAAVTAAQNQLSKDQAQFSTDQGNLANANTAVTSAQAAVNTAQSAYDAAKAQLSSDKQKQFDDGCTTSPPTGDATTCAADQLAIEQDNDVVADKQSRLNDAKAVLSSAQSQVSQETSASTSSANKIASDESAVQQAQNSATNAINNQTAGKLKDQQAIASAQSALTSALNNQTAGKLKDRQAIASAQSALTSALLNQTAGKLKDQQAIASAENAVENALRSKAAQALSGRQTVSSARNALHNAHQSYRSGKVKGQQTLSGARNSVANQKGSLESTLAANVVKEQPPKPGDLAAAQTSVETSQISVDAARLALRQTTLRAPIAGTVAAGSGAVGQDSAKATSSTASASSTPSGFVVLTDLDHLQLQVGFSESDAAKLKIDQPATVSVAALPDRKLAAHVVAVDVTATVVNNVVTYYATFSLDRTRPRLKPGMTANVDVVVAERANVLNVPNSAVTQVGGNSFVTVVDSKGKQTRVPVVTGITSDTATQIVGGLSEGQRVVLASAAGLGSTNGGGGFPRAGAGGGIVVPLGGAGG